MPGSRSDELAQTGPDDLLSEVQGRLSNVIGTHDRLRRLLEAVMAVGENLDLQGVLRRIASAAADLVEARYAALGVISDDGQGLSQFIVVGIDHELVETIGGLPAGMGVLGELIRDPAPLRLHDLAQHPESYGLPPGHPPMRSFLGVPIRVRDAVFGNLYLTEKVGGGDFDEQDEAIVQALATAAGVAVQNARLYADAELRSRMVEASSEVSTALLSGSDPEQVLALIAARAREVTQARLTFAALPMGDGRLLVEVADGEQADALRGRLLSAAGTGLDEVVASGEARSFQHHSLLGGAPGLAVPLAGPDAGFEGGGAPGGGASAHRGVLAVVGLTTVSRQSATRMVAAFAAQASVALELAERRRSLERYAVFEDRDRIARDLHDLVIQRLFATGMQLEGATRLITERPQEAARRVLVAVDDLDATIRELRSTIYSLQAPAGHAVTLRTRVLEAVDVGTEQLAFTPGLRMEGLLDSLVDDELGAHLVACLREALSNAARHASAGAVDVRVAVDDGRLVLEVQDDGVGMPAAGRRSGLANLAARADDSGGELRLHSRTGGGTRLVWSVPLAGPA